MASFNNLTPGIYWSSNLSSWETLTKEIIENKDSDVNNAQYILIVTGIRDVNRRSFHVQIPKVEVGKERELKEFNISKKYGTIYQWQFFLAYKDIINALTSRLNEASKLDVEEGRTTVEYDHDFQGTVWTTTSYNNGGSNPNIAIQWTADLSYESARLQFKKDVALEMEITTYNNGGVDNGGEDSYTGLTSLKPYAGAYYTETTLPNVNTVYYPLKTVNEGNSKNAQAIIVNTRQTGDRASFCVYVQAIENIGSGPWTDSRRTLTKYQWQMFFAYSNLIDVLYQDVNENYVHPGELSKYGLPGMIWTSSDYICKPKTLGAAEVSNGNGLKWVVCPAFRSSHIVLRTKTEYNFPTVGPVNDLL